MEHQNNFQQQINQEKSFLGLSPIQGINLMKRKWADVSMSDDDISHKNSTKKLENGKVIFRKSA